MASPADTAREAARTEALGSMGFGPPVQIADGGPFAMFLRHEYTVCQKCGAMIRLGDHEEVTHDGTTVTIEKNIRLHIEFHEANDG